jgi:hypothetical protein
MTRSRLVLAFVLTVSLIAAPSFAAVKAGAKCTKAGATATAGGKKFTCVKSGKKIVWNKGVKVSVAKPVAMPTPSASAVPTVSATPTPTPTPSSSPVPIIFSPWLSKFETKLMTQAALDATNSYFGKVTPDNSFEFTIDPAISASDQTWISTILNYTNGAFSNVSREKMRVFLGTNHVWSRDTLRSLKLWMGDPNGPYPCSNGNNDAGCANKNLVLLIFSDIYATNSTASWDIGRRSTPAHEVFHTVQLSLIGYDLSRIPPGGAKSVPRWFMEGSANYFGYYTVEKLGFDSYQNGRNNQVRLNPEYKTKKPLSTYDNFESNPYGIGQAATEYIIASVGFESLLNICKFTGSEGSFEAGFKKATGLELSEFYTKFEDARSSMQIGS